MLTGSIDKFLAWINRKLNPPDRVWSLCLNCGRKYIYAGSRRDGRKPGYCTPTCADVDRWREG
jgi:hypothetical protein